jgi:hypothetical protein
MKSFTANSAIKDFKTKDGRRFGDLSIVYYLNCFELTLDEYKTNELVYDGEMCKRKDGKDFDYFSPRAFEFFGSLNEAQKALKNYLEFSLNYHRKQKLLNDKSIKNIEQRLENLAADMAEYRTPSPKQKDEKTGGFRL